VTLSNSSFRSNFPFIPGTTKFYLTCNITNELTSVANSQNNTYFYWSNVIITSNYTFSNALRVNASASNLNFNGTNSNFAFMDIGRRNLFFDSASVLLRDATKNSNYVSGALNYGLRVESGVGAYPRWNETSATSTSNFGFPYIDSNILTGSYSNELQIVNGAYVGTNTNCNYLNSVLYTPPAASYSYPNYSTVYTTGRMRYATFMWYINANIQNIAFSINNHNFVTTTDPTSEFNEFPFYTNGVTLHYQVISFNLSPYYPALDTNNTSAWLNGNQYIPGGARTFNTWRSKNGIGGAQDYLSYVNGSNLRAVAINDNEGVLGIGPLLFFIRIGIPTNSNYYFGNVELINFT
jgi:hypothetical protein